MATDRPPFRPDMEGLRGVAILLVVGFHAGVSWLAGGFVGVDVFFVLSGYFITALLLREVEDTGGIDVPGFYGRRAARLLPMLFVVLLATLALVMWLYAPIDRAPVASAARAAALSASNMEFASGAVDYFRESDNPLLHTWTLAVEQQFYFVWPVLILLAIAWTGSVERDAIRRRVLWSTVIVGAVSFIASLWLSYTAPSWGFFSLATRVWEFAAGGVLALFLSDATRATRRAALLQGLGLGAIALALFLFDDVTPYPGAAALLPAFGAAAMLAGGHGHPSTRTSMVLSHPVLRWLGRHSYSWYLWHWPLIVIVAALQPDIGVRGRLGWSLAALGLAVLTHRYVEQPARSGGGILRRVPEERMLMVALGASFVMALVAHGALLAARAQASSPSQRAFAAARVDRKDHGCWARTLDDWKGPGGPCVFGDKRSSTTLVLLGDSHAEHWLGALDRVGRERGWRIVAMVKGGCPAADIPRVMTRARRRMFHECSRFRDGMLQRIVAMRPDGVILSSWDHYVPVRGQPSSRWQVSLAEWEHGLRRTYARLSQAGIPVAAIRGTPRTWFDVPSCLSRRAAGLPFAGRCEYDRARSLSPSAAAAQDRAARGLPIAFVNMNDAICRTMSCPTMVNGIVVFTDDNHLTASFSRSLSPVLGPRLAAAFPSLR